MATTLLPASHLILLPYSCRLYLRNGGKLEVVQQMANHESARTTGFYDRRDDQLTLDEVERILI